MSWGHALPQMEIQKRWADTAAWWSYVSGEKSMDATNCRESSTV